MVDWWSGGVMERLLILLLLIILILLIIIPPFASKNPSSSPPIPPVANGADLPAWRRLTDSAAARPFRRPGGRFYSVERGAAFHRFRGGRWAVRESASGRSRCSPHRAVCPGYKRPQRQCRDLPEPDSLESPQS